MIIYLQNKDIHKQQWDKCIEQSINGNLYALSDFLDTSCGKWDALIEDNYKAIMPLPVRKKWGIHYIFLPSLVQQLGIFSPSEISKEKTEEFIRAIPKKFFYGQINFNHHNPLPDKRFNISTHINLELPLNQPYESIQKRYSENIKRNLKKCPTEKLEIRKEEDITSLITLFRQNLPLYIKKLPDDYYNTVKNIGTLLIKTKKAELWKIFYEGKFSAGILFAFCKNKAVFLFSAANRTAKKISAMHYMIDRFIYEHASSSLTLDFEGSDYPSLYRFYKSFGAIEKNYWQLKINRLPWPLNLF